MFKKFKLKYKRTIDKRKQILNNLLYSVVIILTALLISFSYQINSVTFKNYKAGQVAVENIESPRSIEVIDELKTEEKKEQLLKNAEEKYILNAEIGSNVNFEISTFFDELETVHKDRKIKQSVDEEIKKMNSQKEKIEKQIQNLTKKNNDVNKLEIETKVLNEELQQINETIRKKRAELEKLKLDFDEEKNTLNLNESNLDRVLSWDKEKIKTTKEAIIETIDEFYSKEISKNNLEEEKRNFVNHINILLLDNDVRAILIPKINQKLTHNLYPDFKEIQKEKERIEEEFTPVYINVQKGEVIVREGEVIQDIHIEIMKKAGIISNEKFKWNDFWIMSLFSLIILILFHLIMSKYSESVVKNKSMYILLYLTIIHVIFATNFINDIYITYFLYVFALMTFATFLKPNATIFFAIILGILIDINNYEFLLLAIILGVHLMISYKQLASRTEILNTGLLLGIIGSLVMVIFDFMNTKTIHLQHVYPIIFGSLLGTATTIGLFPYLEKIFGVTTSVRLNELTKHDHPLIKQMIKEAHGTYHHSIRVANMAELAAEAIGANFLLVKVAAYFHDVGKLEKPYYFIENQGNGPNPHDKLTPLESAEIIKKHPIHSVELCKKYHLPKEVISIVEKHHSDSLIEYFYQKAKKQGSEVDEKQFRYNTPKPVTKEESILLLADGVEAYSRTLLDKDANEIKKCIETFIDKKIQSGVLDKSELTLKDIQKIKCIFVDFILSANHKRIEYEKN